MEDIVETKGIEKIEVSEPKVEEVVEKKRKPRSEAQKAAFEKARKKRAENLAKKKLEAVSETATDVGEKSNTTIIGGTPQNPVPEEVSANSPEVRPKAPTKKRGRPKGSKKLKREPEPKVGQPNFLPQNIPPDAGDLRYQYHQQNPYQINPMMMYQQPPQVHNYYYGHQQTQPHPQPQQPPPPQRPPSPEVVEETSSEEEEWNEQPVEYPPDAYREPQLRYRFC